MADVLIAILAAGQARRFGGGKLDAVLRGKPVGAWALGAAADLGAPVVVIGGGEPLGFVPPECRLVVNDRASEGMGTSLALAARLAREEGFARLLVMLADMPFVSGATLRELLAAEGTAACVYGAKISGAALGPPACFWETDFAALEALPPERGAGAWLKARAGLRVVRPERRELFDIDTRADLLDAESA